VFARKKSWQATPRNAALAAVSWANVYGCGYYERLLLECRLIEACVKKQKAI